MTFEEFKKQVEVFGKIDTPEKLAFYQRRYEDLVLKAEDENYFEPTTPEPADSIVCRYRKSLDEIFGLDRICENQYFFLTMPSSEPEKMLIVTQQAHQYILSAIKMSENYWAAWYAGKLKMTGSTSTSYTLPKSCGDKLFNLLDKIMEEARPPKSRSMTLDGVTCELSKLSAGTIRSVRKHSPGVDSRSGRLIGLLEQLAMRTGELNEDELAAIETKIDELVSR